MKTMENTMTPVANDTIRKAVREQYGKVADAAPSSQASSCATTSCCNGDNSSAESMSIALGYSNQEVIAIPEGANMGLGCGNPQAIAALKQGETVLDLGSGGGFDCFLAAEQVGQSGHVIGVDMTPEMLSKARNNVTKTAYNHVEFRLGEIEHLPVADNSIDVIISNCVINLSPAKESVFQEAFRVLKSGGRLAIADIVATAALPKELQEDMTLLTGCMSGASYIADIQQMLEKSGFSAITIKPKDESKTFIRQWAVGTHIEDYIVSATIEAVKA